MANGLVVLKFGGTSVSTGDRWQTITGIVSKHVAGGDRVVLVLSAIAGTTDDLIALCHAPERQAGMQLATRIETRYRDLAKALTVELTESMEVMVDDIGRAAEEGVSTQNYAAQADLIARGETLCAHLAQRYLSQIGLLSEHVDARHLLRADAEPGSDPRSHYLSSLCGFGRDSRLNGKFPSGAEVIVTQGFLASDREGRTVLLGRGGSDTSAACLASALGAQSLEIWTDVPGMFSADPRVVSSARLLKTLSYDEAREIATTGGKVLHPRCIRPLQEARIPLWVRSTQHPELAGTKIAEMTASEISRVKAVSLKQGVTLIAMETVGMWHQPGFLADAFAVFRALGVSVDLISTSETNVTVSIDPVVRPVTELEIKALKDRLSTFCKVSVIDQCAAISLVGQGIRGILHQIGDALSQFENERLYLVTQSANDLNFSIVVDQSRAARILNELHESLIGQRSSEPAWEELRDGASQDQVSELWWRSRRNELLALMTDRESAYVYHLPGIGEAASGLMSMRSLNRCWYAMKANSHPAVLDTVVKAGLGLECTSPGEMGRALEHTSAKNVLFTPNFVARDEYAAAFAAGVQVTIDSLYVLRQWGDLLKGREVLLRVDLASGSGHHQHVRTEGSRSKFGIPLTDLGEAAELATAHGCQVIGLHSHAGSGIMNEEHWPKAARDLSALLSRFPDVRVVNVGGGLGVPDQPGRRGLNLEALDQRLAQVFGDVPDIEVWMEPGRFLVAANGVLLARVTQVKEKGSRSFVGVSTGINSLIRPALYGAWHLIVNLSRVDEPANRLSTVVGPICETGDSLGRDRMLPECQEGDVVLVANAGAYGRVMSSNYNLREPAEELTLD